MTVAATELALTELCVHIPMGWQPMGVVSWYQMDRQQKIIAHGQASFDTLASHLVPQPITVRLDSALVLATQVKLPPKSHAQRMALVPVLLEEQLMTSLDSNYFCVGHALSDGQTPVRVVDKAWWQTLFVTAKSAGFPIKAAWSDQDYLPRWARDYTALVPESPETLVQAQEAVQENAVNKQQTLSGGMTTLCAPTGHFSVQWGIPPVVGASVEGSDVLVGEVFHRLPFNAKPHADAVSLLQGAWAPVSWLDGGQWFAWRWTLALLALCAVLWLTAIGQKSRVLSQQLSTVRADISARFHAAFPSQPEVDALLQTRQALGLPPDGGTTDKATKPIPVRLLTQVNTVSEVLHTEGILSSTQSDLTGLRADNTTITLQLKKQAADRGKLTEAFARKGFRAQTDEAGLSWQLTVMAQPK